MDIFVTTKTEQNLCGKSGKFPMDPLKKVRQNLLFIQPFTLCFVTNVTNLIFNFNFLKKPLAQSNVCLHIGD